MQPGHVIHNGISPNSSPVWYISFNFCRFPGTLSSGSFISGIILLSSAFLQLLAVCHISLHRRKYKKQDDTVYSIYIPPPNEDNELELRNQNHLPEPVALNTNSHNPILFDFGCMCVYAIILIFVVIIAFCLPSAFNAKNSERIFYVAHFIDLTFFFVLNVVLPCVFYTANDSARNYIKSLFFGK